MKKIIVSCSPTFDAHRSFAHVVSRDFAHEAASLMATVCSLTEVNVPIMAEFQRYVDASNKTPHCSLYKINHSILAWKCATIPQSSCFSFPFDFRYICMLRLVVR